MFHARALRRTLSPRTDTQRKFRPRLEALEDRMAPSAGDLDLSFGGNGTGKASYPVSTSTFFESAVAMQNDGRIVTAFTIKEPDGTHRARMARFTFDGLTDPIFNNLGPPDSDASDVAIQADGKIVVTGTVGLFGNEDFFVMRFLSDGNLDSSFGNGDGLAVIDFGGSDSCNGVAVQDDGRIVLAGSTLSAEFEFQFAVARLLPNGELDSGFDVDGKVTTSFNGFDDALGRDVAIQNDGRIVVAGQAALDGQFAGNFALARYNSDGSRDTSFNFGGRIVTPFPGGESAARSLAIQADNNIVLAGFAFVDGHSDFALARYNSNGSLDTSYGDSGRVRTDFAPGLAVSRDSINSIVVMSNGKIVVGGETDYGGSGVNFALARYDSSGQLDTTFSSDGLVATDFSGTDLAEDGDRAYGVALQGGLLTQRIIAVGAAGDNLALAAYESKTFVGNFFLEVNDDIASLIGSDGDDECVITDLGGGEVEFSTPDGQERVTVSGANVVSIQANDGDDTVLIRQEPRPRSEPTSRPTTFVYDGGSGDNKLIVEGGPGSNVISVTGVEAPDPREPDPHTSLFNVATGLQTDVFARNLGVLSYFTGDGDDVIDVQWDPEQFAGVHTLRIDTGAGDDQVSVQGEVLGGAGGAARAIIGKLSLEIFAGADDDSVQIHLATTDVPQVQIDVRGEEGNDLLDLTMAVAFNPQPDPPEAVFVTSLDGGTGDDVLSQFLTLPAQFIPPSEWSPSASMTLIGGHGNDEVLAGMQGYIAPASRLDLAVQLGNGRNAADLFMQGLSIDGTFAASVSGGNEADEVGIIIDNQHVGRTGAMTWVTFLGNGENSFGMQLDEMTIDGAVAVTTMGGNGADEVGIVPINGHVSAGASLALITYLGNGDNSANVQFEGLMNEGTVAVTTVGGAAFDEVTSVGFDTHVGRTGALTINTFLGNGYNIGRFEFIDSNIEGQVAINTVGGMKRDEISVMFRGGQIAAGATVGVRMLGFGGPNFLRTDVIDVVHAGNLRLQMTGGRHRDVIAAVLDLDRASTGAVFAQLRAGAGNDMVRFDLLGARLARILPGSIADGGPGYDGFRGNAKLRRINFEY